jgi:hypothetical protein
MAHVVRRHIFVLAMLVASPSLVFAQASIAGVAKDTSGAVLPGVSVEASSPALIEKTRAAVTDADGQYKIVDLRPGTYAVTFTLPGFATVRREGIELTGAFTASVNADMRVGALEETVTVTGQSPVVDLQSTNQERSLGAEVIDNIPSSRTHFSVGALVPSVQSNNTSDVGGTNAIAHVFLTAHGGRTTDQRVTLDGLSTNNAEGASQFSGYLINMGSTQELTIDYAAGSADQPTGGVRLNVIPREGGNRFAGTFFATGMGGSALQATNFDAELEQAGLPAPQAIKKLWDVNPSFGGPVFKDKLWFYVSGRTNGQDIYGGGFENLNAGNPNSFAYAPDTSKPTFNHAVQKSLNGRATLQATPRNKFNMFYDEQSRCWCPRNLSPLQSPEAVGNNQYPYSRLASITWSSPITNRILVEGGLQYHPERWGYPDHPEYGNLVGIVDQANMRQYRGQTFTNANGLYPQAYNGVVQGRVNVSYVTGTHAFKVGFTNQHATRQLDVQDNPLPLSYRFNNGVPNQITQRSTPFEIGERIKADLGIYAQDKWTIDRLTLNLGVRFDYFNTYFPDQYLGPSMYTPNRNITFRKTPWVNWKDITPRMGLAYDLFGNGKTAAKVTLNKYMNAFGLQGSFGGGSNPINLTSNTVTRPWNDTTFGAGDPRSGNFQPDCDLVNPLLNGECGQISDLNFGNPRASAAVDPDVLRGWGKRGNNWEFSTGIQHELFARTSMDVSYYRRSYGNFITVDNRATTTADYKAYTVTAPSDPRLPNGGGYTVSGLYDLDPTKNAQIDNYFTFSDNYGKGTEIWNGLDLSVNTRLQHGLLLQAGLSTGRTRTDFCEVVAKAPEAITGNTASSATAPVSILTANQTTYCAQNTGYLTQYKGYGSYLIPKIDVQTSVTFQSLPGPALLANYVATNGVISPSLGRNLSGGVLNATVNLVAPGSMYGKRINNVDLRLAKILRAGRTKTMVSLDAYNLFNINTITTYNNAFASWQAPVAIQQARFAKFSVQFDF